jgi:hypothetical protein
MRRGGWSSKKSSEPSAREWKADQFDFILNRVMEQAAALYSEWPMVE